MPTRDPSERQQIIDIFTTWLTRQLDEQSWRNADLKRRLDKVGAAGRWGSGTVDGWKSGAALPSETACMYLAKAFDIPMPEALAAAGYADAAELVSEATTTTDPTIRLIRERSKDLSPEQRARLVEGARQQISDLREYADLRIDKYRRENKAGS